MAFTPFPAYLFLTELKSIISAKKKGTTANVKTNTYSEKTDIQSKKDAALCKKSGIFQLGNRYQDFQKEPFVFFLNAALAAIPFNGFLDIGKSKAMH